MTINFSRILHLTSLLIGIAILMAMFIKLDTKDVVEQMLQVGVYFTGALVCYFLSLFVSAYIWQLVVDDSSSSAVFWDFLAALWAGHAINQVTPIASLGEITKCDVLKGKIPGEELVASLIIVNFLGTLVTQITTMTGPLIVLVTLDLPSPVVYVVFGLALVMCLPVTGLYFLLKSGLAVKVILFLAKIPFVQLKNLDVLLQRTQLIDEKIRTFIEKRPKDLSILLLNYLVVRILGVFEIFFLLCGLLPDQTLGFILLFSLFLQVSGQLVVWSTSFVPGQIGFMEMGSMVVFKLVGLDPMVGLSMELLRRVRKIIGIGIGLLILLLLGIKPLKTTDTQ